MPFISSKKLFPSWRYSNFCISVLPSFSASRPLLWRMIEDKSSSSWRHQLTTHKNSITHFVWYLEKNHAKNVQQKLVPHLFIILVNNPKQPLHAINYLKSKILWKRIIKKPWKGNFDFSFEPSPFQKTKISKTKGAWN